jgi:hypothetical protein
MILATNALRQWCLDNGIKPPVSISVDFASDEDCYSAIRILAAGGRLIEAARPAIRCPPFDLNGIRVIPGYKNKAARLKEIKAE